jgi:hypothetical protein
MALETPMDAALPALEHALDTASMARVFATMIDTHHRVVDCTIERAKYRPGRNCSVSYRLRLRNDGGHAFEQLVSTRFCSHGNSLVRWQRSIERAPVNSPAGPAVSHAPQLDMVAHWVPNDAKLDAVRLLLDDTAMRQRCLPDVVAALTQAQGQLVDHRTTLLQLVAELRVCARVDLRVALPGQREPVPFIVYAKADLEHPGERTHAAMLALARSPARAQGLFRTPTPLMWQASSGLHWQAHVAGRALGELASGIEPSLAGRLGSQLAALHATAVDGLPLLDGAELRARVQRTHALLLQTRVANGPRLEGLVTRLLDGAAALEGLPMATLHGDLHANNILIDGDHASFVDLDSMTSGAAMVELGEWFAAELHGAMLQGRPLESAVPAWRSMLRAYVQRSPHPVDVHRLGWCAAYALFCTRVHRSVANLKPGRSSTVPATIDLADAIVRRGSIEAALHAGA